MLAMSMPLEPSPRDTPPHRNKSSSELSRSSPFTFKDNDQDNAINDYDIGMSEIESNEQHSTLEDGFEKDSSIDIEQDRLESEASSVEIESILEEDLETFSASLGTSIGNDSRSRLDSCEDFTRNRANSDAMISGMYSNTTGGVTTGTLGEVNGNLEEMTGITLPSGVSLRDHQEDQLMRILIGRYRDDSNKDMSPALEWRLRDFQFAQKKRREKYGSERPFGILGLYDHLSGIRTDVEWAEDAAWRRENHEPYLSWVDFEAAKDTGFNQPFFTYIIMFVCTLCLLVSIGVNNWSVERLSVNPMIGPSAQTLIDMGAKQTSLIVIENEWYRLFTPMLLHAGLIHYFLNMLALWFIGSAVELSHGFLAAATLFIIPAIGGTIMSSIFLPEYISVGASGGIFGLIGACVADIITNWKLLFSKEVNQNDEGSQFRHIKVLLWLIFDIAINCLIGLTPFVDNFTHLGGMMYGFLCGLTTMERLSNAFFGVRADCAAKFRSTLLRFFGLIFSLLMIIVTVIILAESEGRKVPCKGCRYVSCVPFPFWADQDEKWWYCDDCPLAQAEAHQDKETNYYSSIDLTCPDGTIEYIDLSRREISDKQWLQKRLPTFCRDHCANVFSS